LLQVFPVVVIGCSLVVFWLIYRQLKKRRQKIILLVVSALARFALRICFFWPYTSTPVLTIGNSQAVGGGGSATHSQNGNGAD